MNLEQGTSVLGWTLLAFSFLILERNLYSKPICAKILILKLIRFQGCSHTYFSVNLGVYLTFKGINISTITRQRTYNRDSEEKNWKNRATIVHVNIIQNQSRNRYDFVVLILKKVTTKILM
jgi:hypothetical protein